MKTMIFYIGHLLPENTDLTKIEETVIQSDNKFMLSIEQVRFPKLPLLQFPRP